MPAVNRRFCTAPHLRPPRLCFPYGRKEPLSRPGRAKGEGKFWAARWAGVAVLLDKDSKWQNWAGFFLVSPIALAEGKNVNLRKNGIVLSKRCTCLPGGKIWEGNPIAGAAKRAAKRESARLLLVKQTNCSASARLRNAAFCRGFL